jgi:hypothetical protein
MYFIFMLEFTNSKQHVSDVFFEYMKCVGNYITT